MERNGSNQSEEANDASLLAEAINGDRNAFGLLFKRHYSSCLRTAQGILGCEAEAADVTQTAWIKAWQSIGEFQPQATFSTWVHRIAINAALDELRRRKRWRNRFSRLFDRDSADAHDSITDDQPSPSAQLLASESHQQVRTAIQRLPENLRVVIVLRELESLSYREIADSLGIAEGTVMSRLYKARQTLANMLKEELQ